MNRTTFSCFVLAVALAGAPRFFSPSFASSEQEQRSPSGAAENGQRWAFTLQYEDDVRHFAPYSQRQRLAFVKKPMNGLTLLKEFIILFAYKGAR